MASVVETYPKFSKAIVFSLGFSIQFYDLFQVHFTPLTVDVQQQVQNWKYWIC